MVPRARICGFQKEWPWTLVIHQAYTLTLIPADTNDKPDFGLNVRERKRLMDTESRVHSTLHSLLVFPATTTTALTEVHYGTFQRLLCSRVDPRPSSPTKAITVWPKEVHHQPPATRSSLLQHPPRIHYTPRTFHRPSRPLQLLPFGNHAVIIHDRRSRMMRMVVRCWLGSQRGRVWGGRELTRYVFSIVNPAVFHLIFFQQQWWCLLFSTPPSGRGNSAP